MRKILLVAKLCSLCCILLLVLYACRKQDHLNENSAEYKKQITQKFFSTSGQVDPAVIKVINKLKKYPDYFPAFIKRNGFAIWDRAMVVNGSPRSQGHNTTLNDMSSNASTPNSHSHIALIPLVKEGDRQVKNMLACRIVGDSVTATVVKGGNYKFYNQYASQLGIDGTQISLLLMSLSKNVFGHENFIITDSSVFTGNDGHSGLISLNADSLPSQNITNSAGQPTMTALSDDEEYVCVTVRFRKLSPDYIATHGGQVTGIPGWTNNWEFYQQLPWVYETETYCTWVWVEGDGAGSGTGGTSPPPGTTPGSPGTAPGTGGSGGSGEPPIDDPCDPEENPMPSPTTPSSDPAVPCDSTDPPWVPVEPGAGTFNGGSTHRLPAEFNGNRTYISPSGQPLKMPVDAKVFLFNHYDVRRLSNGALYSFQTSSGTYTAVFEDISGSGGIAASKPEFMGYFKVNAAGNAVTSEKYVPDENDLPAAPDPNGNVNVVRFRIEKNADGSCKTVREVVQFQPQSSPNTASNGGIVGGELNDKIEYSSKTPSSPREELNITGECPGGGSGPINNDILQDNFIKKDAPAIKKFLQDRVKNSVKIIIYDCETNKAEYSITEGGTQQLSGSMQDSELNKFNNNEFTPSDEDFAIKACIQNDKWNFEIKHNTTRINVHTAHDKIKPEFNQVMAEIYLQATKQAQKINKVEYAPRNGEKTITVETDAGTERFHKVGMNFFETLIAFLDLGKEIVMEGKIPESLWNQGRTGSSATPDPTLYAKYLASPFNILSTPGGMVDQIIEETLGAVQLVKTLCEIIGDFQTFYDNAYDFIRTLNKEKIKQLLSSISGLDNYNAGGDRATYQMGKHTIQGMMIAFVVVKASANGIDAIKDASKEFNDVQKLIPNGSTNHAATSALKNAIENNKTIKRIDNDKVVMQNVENGQNVVVGIEKKADDVEVYKYSKDDYKNPDGTTPNDNLLEEYVKQDMTDIEMPVHTSRPPDFPDAGTPGTNVGYHPQGRKNIGWNKELNELPPKANHKYVTKNATFQTDGSGKVTKVEIPNLQKDPNFDYNQFRNGHQQKKAVNKKDGQPGTDQGGHLLGNQFGGPGEQINLVAMSKSLNQGAWKNMEQDWANKIQNGINITNIKIDITYGPNGRPLGFDVEWFENGVKKTSYHAN